MIATIIEERKPDPIRAAMERAPEVEWLTPEQRAESDEALARLRRGEARLVRLAQEPRQ